MIKHLRGCLTQRSPTHAVIDVNGVGYGTSISLNTFESLPEVGGEVQLFTFTYVREDRLELFGFAEEDERAMFEMLIAVSGIGPNLAQTILSGMSVADLQRAIHQERAADLTRVRGIGRKTAERLVIELKDKIETMGGSLMEKGTIVQPSTAADEAVLAIIALGNTPAAAQKSVASAARQLGPDTTVQALIKRALQER